MGSLTWFQTVPLKIDLMEMARQYHDSKLYKIGFNF